MKYRKFYIEIASKAAYNNAMEKIVYHIHNQGTLVQPGLHEKSNSQWKKDQFGIVEYEKGNYFYHIDAHKKVRRLDVILSSTDDDDLEKRIEDLKFGTDLKEANS